MVGSSMSKNNLSYLQPLDLWAGVGDNFCFVLCPLPQNSENIVITYGRIKNSPLGWSILDTCLGEILLIISLKLLNPPHQYIWYLTYLWNMKYWQKWYKNATKLVRNIKMNDLTGLRWSGWSVQISLYLDMFVLQTL